MIALIAAACAGMAAWFSIGALAVTWMPGGEVGRVGLLPPFWLLPLLVAGGIALARIVRLSPRTSLPLFGSLLLVLPWIPGGPPAAFLIWTGRVAMGVWVCIAVAMLAGREQPVHASSGRQRPGAWSQDPGRAPRVAAAVACVLYIGSAWWLADILPGGDEPNYLLISQSLLKDGDLRLENNHADRDYAEYFRGNLPIDYLRRGTNGAIYSVHAPGLSAVIAPAFALGGYPGAVVFLSLVAALGGALMWTSAYQLTGSPVGAWFAWAGWALTVPFFFQAFSVFPDGLGATVVLFAVQPLLQNEKGTVAFQQLKRVRPLFLAGTALALLPWLHTRFAIIAVALGVCITLRLLGSAEGRERLPWFLAVPVLSAAAWFAFFRAIYGTFNPAAPYNGYTQSSASNILTGLPALLFDQQFGLLPYAPVYAFSLVGLAMLARARPRLAAEISVTALLYLLSSSAYHMWWGGNSAPTRFAVPVLPLLALPGAWIWTSARHSGTRALGFALLILSVAATATAVAVDGGQLAYNFRDGYSRLAEWISPVVDLPQALPSFFRETPGLAVLYASVWLGAIGLAWIALTRSPRVALAGVTPVVVAIAVMISATIVWKLQNVAGTTPDMSSLSLLQHGYSRFRPVGIDLARLSLVPREPLISRLAIFTPPRRPAPSPDSLLVVPDVLPAGSYAVMVANPSDARGTATLVIGRNARPIATWNLATDVRDGAVHFDLPVDVGSILIKGDDEAVRRGGTMSLRPIELLPWRQRIAAGYARRVEAYGPALTYFFDDEVFVEEPGFWVRGGARARFAVMPVQPGGPAQIFIRNAAANNRVIVDFDGRAQTLDLQPREEKNLPMTFASGRPASLVTIQSDAGFRPSEVEAGSTDNRYLGVWIELRK